MELENHKMKMIRELKTLNKEKMFEKPNKKPKTGLLKKILFILGYEKKT